MFHSFLFLQINLSQLVIGASSVIPILIWTSSKSGLNPAEPQSCGSLSDQLQPFSSLLVEVDGKMRQFLYLDGILSLH